MSYVRTSVNRVSAMLVLEGVALCIVASTVTGQVTAYPYVEAFDSSAALPPGWSSTRARHPLENDASVSTSIPRSAPNCVLITNATVGQVLTGPLFVFPAGAGADLTFQTRRSASFGATVYLEVSPDSGRSFSPGLTLLPSGGTGYVPSMVSLDTLPGVNRSAILRWRVRPDSTGSTGTFRLDDVAISALPTTDAALAVVRILDGPAPGSAVIEAGVRNAGRRAIGGFSVEGYTDLDLDGWPEEEERFAAVTGGSLASGDTSFYHLGWSPGAVGPLRLIILVRCTDDGNSGNDRKDTTVQSGAQRRRVVINEIMYAPSGDEPEWVEILNPGVFPVSLAGWSITDAGVGNKHPWARTCILSPGGGSAVLCKDSAALVDLRSLNPGVIIPVPGFPSLNNSGDAVVLFDERGRMVDSVYYQPLWSTMAGTSLERVDGFDESVRAANWGSCIDTTGATPGMPNSIRRLDRDLSAGRLGVEQHAGKHRIVLVLTIRNAGRLPAGQFLVRFTDRRKGLAPANITLTAVPREVQPGDSLDVAWEWEDPAAGAREVEGSVEWDLDERDANNRVEVPVWIPFARCPLAVSEIMAAPLPGDAEYIEVANIGDRPIDLRDWTANGRVLAEADTLLPLAAGAYSVIASDSGLYQRFPWLRTAGMHVRITGTSLGLNNEADTVVLRDPHGAAADSLRYESSWHNPLVIDRMGRSLEKIRLAGPGTDRKNWSTCLNAVGGTPGAPNSLQVIDSHRSTALSADPNPFSPDADGHDDFAVLRYEVPEAVAAVSATIFDARGRLVRHLASGQPVSASGEMVWDGLDDRGRSLPLGPYVAVLEGSDRSGTGVYAVKCVVVIARRL